MQGVCKLQNPSFGAEQATVQLNTLTGKDWELVLEVLSCHSRRGAGLLAVEAPAGLTSLGPRAKRSKRECLGGDSVSPCLRAQASFTERLICKTQALPGQAANRVLLDWSLNLALSNAFVKSLIKTGLVILHPGDSANVEDLLAFP